MRTNLCQLIYIRVAREFQSQGKISGKVREKSGNFGKMKCWPPCISTFVPVKTVLKSKLTTVWHISEGTFYRKHIHFLDTLIFYNKKLTSVFRFSINKVGFFEKMMAKWALWGGFVLFFSLNLAFSNVYLKSVLIVNA